MTGNGVEKVKERFRQLIANFNRKDAGSLCLITSHSFYVHAIDWVRAGCGPVPLFLAQRATSKNRGGEMIARREKSKLVELGVHS